MSDQCEEQEMEAEALAAIFDAAFEARSSEQPFSWAIRLVPIDCGGDEEEEAKENHVAAKVLATIPLNYPESLPELDIEILKVRRAKKRLGRAYVSMHDPSQPGAHRILCSRFLHPFERVSQRISEKKY